ncbi:MAG: hypothetical protein ACRCVY_09880, partial [Commensalibacter sp.]
NFHKQRWLPEQTKTTSTSKDGYRNKQRRLPQAKMATGTNKDSFHKQRWLPEQRCRYPCVDNNSHDELAGNSEKNGADSPQFKMQTSNSSINMKIVLPRPIATEKGEAH